MPQSFSNIWIHATWATKLRLPVLDKKWRFVLFTHILEEAKNKGIRIDFINGVEDHIHILFKLHTTQTVAKIMKTIKGASSRWINEQNYMEDEEIFSWQDGYGAISVSPDRIPMVRNYIKNQEIHHQSKTYEEELKKFRMYDDV